MILAGIDEAGYGPTLGPLVVAGTVFRIADGGNFGANADSDGNSGSPGSGRPEAEGDAPDRPAAPDLWKVLRRSTCRKPSGNRIAVNDSKKLYQAKQGLQVLEEGGLAFLQLLDGRLPADFRTLLVRLSGASGGAQYLDHYPWYRDRNLDLPAHSYAAYLGRASERLGRDLAATGVEIAGIRAMPIEVLQFNQSLDRLRNKARISFLAVGSLLKRIWSTFPREHIEVMVDRQGGRMRYGPLLYRRLRPRGLRVIEESDEVSRYELHRDGPPMCVTFRVECEESCFPVALASMFCKYLRELHMTLFNRFWCEQVESLRLTAGYHVDAQRFLSEIAGARRRLGIDDAALIRRR